MKSSFLIKSLSFLLGNLFFLSIIEPSYGKETWLKCVRKTFDGKPSQEIKTHIIKLDSKNQRFEIQGGTFEGSIIQGKANYFTSSIQLKFVEQEPPLIFNSTFEINRSNLTYSNLTEMIGYTNSSYIQNGSCKLIPPPSSKTNKI
jgi:hypothetical protein